MSKKCFFIDVDGTIVDMPSGFSRPSKYTKYAFEELAKSNYVFISSGRSMPLMQDFVRNLNPNGYVLSNGAYSILNDKEIHHKPMDERNVIELKKYCLLNNCVYIRETKDKLYINSSNLSLLNRFVKTWKIDENFYYDNDDNECYLFMTICEDEKAAKDFEDKFNKKVDVRRQYGFTSFDVCDFGMNKGYGVKKVIEYLNIDLKDTYAFGDGLNDLEMMENVGHPIAMANAIDKIKEVAEEITESVLEEGLYKYLVSHELIKPLDE